MTATKQKNFWPTLIKVNKGNEKNKQKKHSYKKVLLFPEINLFFFGMSFLSNQIKKKLVKIGNNSMHALDRKKTDVFFGNEQPKSNARAHLKQSKKT